MHRLGRESGIHWSCHHYDLMSKRWDSAVQKDSHGTSNFFCQTPWQNKQNVKHRQIFVSILPIALLMCVLCVANRFFFGSCSGACGCTRNLGPSIRDIAIRVCFLLKKIRNRSFFSFQWGIWRLIFFFSPTEAVLWPGPISLASYGKVYTCFFLLTCPEMSRGGNANTNTFFFILSYIKYFFFIFWFR